MKIFKGLIYYLLLIFLLIYIITMIINPSKMMDYFKFRTFMVLSESMEPTIKVNDLIISREVKENEIEIGDIITFKTYIKEIDSIAFVTHYVGGIKNVDGIITYQTHGENVQDGQFDEWTDKDGDIDHITYSDIQGKYIFRIPLLGYLKVFTSNKILMSITIANIGIIYITVRSFRNYNKKENKRTCLPSNYKP